MMYNPQLDTFICVVETGSFNKAADRLLLNRLIHWNPVSESNYFPKHTEGLH